MISAERWKDLGAAYSLANLFFITSWKALIYPVNNHYFDAGPYSPYAYLAVAANVLLLTLFLFALIRIAGSGGNVWNSYLRGAFVILALVAFCPLSYEVFHWLLPETSRFVNLPVPALVLILCITLSAAEKFELSAITKNLRSLALFLLPFCLFIVLASVKLQLFPDSSIFLPRSTQESIPNDYRSSLKKKVVWVVFDELDFAVLSAANHANVGIPDIERLMDQSLVTKNAFSPNYRTQESIPALLTGTPIHESAAISPDNLLLFPSDGTEPFELRENKDIFTEMVSRGKKSAVVGWYHPYPRIFHEKVSSSYWSAAVMQPCSGFSGFATCNFRVLQRALVVVPFIGKLFPWLPRVNEELWGETRDTQFERNKFLSAKANELAADKDLDFLFFHFSAPHFPFIGRSGLSGKESCYTALEAVNDNLKELRSILESTGQWDDTTLIVSSDHWWRHKRKDDFPFFTEEEREAAAEDIRIPFFIKFAGQESRIDYEPSINTVITKRLILDILDEKIKSYDELPAWLDELQVTSPELIQAQSEGSK